MIEMPKIVGKVIADCGKPVGPVGIVRHYFTHQKAQEGNWERHFRRPCGR